MKTIKHIALGILVVGSAFSITSCKSKDGNLPKGERVIKNHCSGKEYFSDKKTFRANGVGESLDQSTSKKKALANVKTYLASSISTTIKATIDNYVNSREMNNKEQVEERFEGLSREVINQKLSGYRTICEVLTKDDATNKYKTYVAIELGAEDLVDAINERLTKEESLRIDYDYEKFKETFNAEMEKLENR